MFLGLPDPDPLVPGTDPDSGSFYHQAKMVRKNLALTVLWPLCDFLSYLQAINKSEFNSIFFVCKATTLSFSFLHQVPVFRVIQVLAAVMFCGI
jgi:hypothetical protein